MKLQGKIWIGTSGWHYAHWKGVFYPNASPESEWLKIYSQHLDTVEINNTFYGLPPKEHFTTWKMQSPPSFVFSVKASRYLTHMKKLVDVSEAWHALLDRARLLGGKLGPILLQFPGHWKINRQRLEAFLKLVPSGQRLAFEFRDPSWFDQSIYELLENHEQAFCVYDFNHRLSPGVVSANYIYIRLHGPGNAYEGSYSTQVLGDWAETIAHWALAGKDVFCYFDNDQYGYAVQNALTLRRLLHLPESTLNRT